MMIYCVGCGARLFDIEPDSTLCYTCPCRATTFSTIDPMAARGTDEELDRLLLPASFWNYRTGKVDELPHLEYYVGTSNAVNPLKTKLKEKLKEIGGISQAECVVCRARKIIPA